MMEFKGNTETIEDPQNSSANAAEDGSYSTVLLQDTGLYHELFLNISAVILIVDPQTSIILDANPTACKFFGYSQAELIRLKMTDLSILSVDEQKVHLMKFNAKEVPCLYDTYRLANGETRDIEGYLGHANFNDRLVEIRIIIDVTSYSKLGNQISEKEEKYRLITESVADVIWIYNVNQKRFTFVTPNISNLLGYSIEEALSQPMSDYFLPERNKVIGKDMEDLVKELMLNPEMPVSNLRTEQAVRKDGSLVWVEISTAYRINNYHEIELVAITRNIEDRKKKETEIIYLNTHDQITGLLNRNCINQLIVEDERDSTVMKIRSVAFINIDKFRFINETIGQKAGDALLKQIADRIQEIVESKGTAYYNGGDEFVVIFDMDEYGPIHDFARKIQQTISRQVYINQRSMFITASIGISIGKAGISLDQNIRNADAALYVAKKKRNSIAFYTSEMEKARTREELLEQDLYKALDRGQLVLYFQPIFDVRKGIINQAEALLRWNHPEFGQISPGEFIPIAEKTKMIIPITDWVIQQACQKISEWEVIGIHSVMVSVNLSFLAIENRGRELLTTIEDIIKKTGIKPSSLKLEITESTLFNDLDEIVGVFQVLKESGVKLALDDFGTGYSSFGFMKDLPLDIVKLDRSLIQNIVSSTREKMIVQSMITIIHGLDLEVVIEGVETQEQLNQLVLLDCDYIQGFFFSKPLPVDQYEKYYFQFQKNGAKKLFDYSLPEPAVTLEWRDEWLSGNHLIDQQHQELMRFANRLLSLSLDGAKNEVVLPEFDKLLDHLMSHFYFEEKVLSENGYACLSSHAEIHQKILAKAHALRSDFMKNEVKTSAIFSFVFNEFVLNHMLDEDVKFYSFIKRTAEV